MGIDVRKVPEGWEHPTEWKFGHRPASEDPLAYRAHEVSWTKAGHNAFIAQHDEDWLSAWREWQWERIKWYVSIPFFWVATMLGLGCAFSKWGSPRIPDSCSFEEWHGTRPDFHSCHPRWREKDRTHFQLYQTVSEGTPISPVFANLEEMAQWCGTQARPVWVNTRMDVKQWRAFFGEGGSAPSMVITPERGVESGAEWVAATATAKGDDDE